MKHTSVITVITIVTVIYTFSIFIYFELSYISSLNNEIY